MVEVKVSSIPDEIKKIPHWVNWCQGVNEKGEPTKRPSNPCTGGNAQSNNPKTWGTFEQALKRYRECENDHIQGIMFALDGNGLCGMDLDDCIDEEGNIYPLAKDIVDKANSYTEVTPSGKGLRIFAKGELPTGRRKKADFEIYNSGRFLTVTGNHLEGTPATIEQRDKEISEIHQQMFGIKKTTPKKQNTPSASSPLPDDSALLHRAMNAKNGGTFRKLWEGDFSDYPSQSEGDLALCSLLAFWTRNDAGRIDSLFRQSGLMRETKWDEKHYGDGTTYGYATIAKAISEATEGYNPISRDTPTEEKKSIIEVGIHLTDFGNAKRFVAEYGSLFRYCYDLNKFFVWDEQRWTPDNDGAITRLAKQTVMLMYRLAGEEKDKDRREKLGEYALRCESEAKLQAMIELAKSEPGIPIQPHEMDSDPWLFNVQNGTIDLRTGILLKPRREDLITKLAPVHYDPLAECPLWIDHLNKIMANREHLVSFLERAYGYSLTGITDERILFIPWGGGANGKTTTNETVSTILGEDYSTRTPTETLLVKRNEGIPNDLAKLKGQRFVYASETSEDKKLAEALIKDLSGGDKIAARFMRAEWFTFRPTFKLWLSTNHKPVIRGTDDAIWDRIRLIPFTVRIPESERIGHSEMFERFRAEHSGILAWLVRGCLDWQKAGLGVPEEVKEATGQYREEMDLIGDFIKERCEVSKDAEVIKADFYEAYLGWCQKSGERATSKIAFGKTMAERGFVSDKDIRGKRVWKGIKLA